jgi:predicted secreted protein
MNKKLKTLKSKLTDARSHKTVLVAHCLLNQNARYWGGASQSGMLDDFIFSVVKQGTGIIQLPCPEIPAWGGPDKKMIWLAIGQKPILGFLVNMAYPLFLLWTRWSYGMQAQKIVRQVLQNKNSGYECVKIVGIDGSPSCGVTRTLDLKKCFHYHRKLSLDGLTRDGYNKGLYQNCLRPGKGIFMEILYKKLNRYGIYPITEGWSLPKELGLQ